MLALFSWIPEMVEGGGSLDHLHEALLRALDGDARAVGQWIARYRPPPTVALLVKAAAAFLEGRYREISEELKSLPSSAPEGEGEARCHLELLLLRHLVGVRLGDIESSTALLHEIDSLARRLRRNQVLQILGIENASRLMGKGFYHAAIRALLALESEFESGALFWAFRVQTLLGTSFQALGQFAQSRAALERQERLSALAPCANLRLSCLRRRMSLAWESERFEEASCCWELYGNDAAYGLFPTLHVLFLQEKLRLHLARHDEEAVAATFSDIERHVESQKLARAFMSLIEERAEITLRASRPHEAVAVLGPTLDEAALRGDLSGLCAVTIIHARALALGGKLSQAAEALGRALDTADEQGFGKARVRILLFRGAVFHALGQGAEARASLLRGLRLAEELDLPVQKACGSLLVRLVEAGLPRLLPLFELQSSVRTTREVLSYLQFYQTPLQARVRVRIKGESEMLEWPLLDAFPEMARRCLVCLVPAEGFLGLFEEAHTQVLSLGDSEQISAVTTALFRSMIRSGKGLTVEQIHSLLWPRIRFRAWQHGPRVHSLMTRVRRLLRDAGLVLEAHGAPARYEVESLRPLALAEIRKAAQASNELTLRQKEFLELVRSRGRVSTTEICSEMGLSRQTLHPMVQPVLKTGLVKLHRRGRSSFYSWS